MICNYVYLGKYQVKISDNLIRVKYFYFFLCLLLHLVTTQMKANLCAVEDNTFDIFLYATKGDEKVRDFYIYKPVCALCTL